LPRVLGLSLILLGVLWLACQVEGSDGRVTSVVENDRWVRTTDGWERTSQWKWLASYEPALHPLVVATLQLLLTLIAIIAFCTSDPTSKTVEAVVSPGSRRERQLAPTASGGGT
jgi:hypothetical protein